MSPKLTEAQILQALEQNYSLKGKLVPLPSYADLNFKLNTKQSDYVIKIANSADSHLNLDMQNAAMQHLVDQQLPVPHALNNHQQTTITELLDAQGKRCHLRVLSYLEGRFYSDAKPDKHNTNLWRSLGRFLGKIDQALLSFNHPGAYRYIKWDLSHGLGVCQTKKHLLDDDNLDLVEYFITRYQIHVLPNLSNCPQAIIHNDANDYNLLIDQPDDPKAITGIIDFGDMVYSHQINEVAIATAYAILGQDDLQQVITEVITGYHQNRPLNQTELSCVYYLIALRLCTSLCNAAEAIQREPNNEYLLVSVKPAIEALKKLRKLSAFSCELKLLKACGLTHDIDEQYQRISDYRNRHMARSLSLSYQQPLKIERGEGAYLIDANGDAYLDMVNNVCHVGHCHPDVVLAGQRQMAKLNTNTRYLHENIVNFTEKLLATFPKSLSVCMLVNSGSEANELAFRLAQAYTQSKQLIVVDGAYHGNTAACVNASPYKFDGPGGQGAEPHIHKVALPDPYRGIHQGSEPIIAEAYAESVSKAIETIHSNGDKVGAYICESLQGVAGQIIMPNGYLKSVYEKVRAANGVCIADEVQVGFGRVGTHMWAFQTQDVVPDIVTLGKPIGNGHPLAAVIVKKEIADAFANGMEFFNTFGGNPVSCAIGEAVLDVIEKESLQQNALDVGNYMRSELLKLQDKYDLIGDVRGVGLFNGVELVNDRSSKEPATEKMEWLIEHFKRNKILLTSEGPHYNILKIKPPIIFSKQNTDYFIQVLEQGLIELEQQ